jgi:peptidoglycan/LPS O-acetylase OafA/YrhL/O-antigen/teichoic acid export membrane protein
MTTSTLQAPPRHRARQVALQARAVSTDSLYRNSFMLMANTAVQTALGSIFWLVAARRYSESSVGLLTTTLSAVVLISTVSCLGFPNALVRYLPRRVGRTGELAVTTTVFASLCGAVLFGVTALTPWSLPLVRGGASTGLVALGLATVVTCVAGMICDAVFIAQRSSHLLLLKNGLGGLTKVVAVLVLPAAGVADLALANLAGVVAALALAVVLLRPRLSGPIRVQRSALHGAWSFSIGNHVGMIFGILPLTATPLIVLAALGARQAAFFGIAMMLLGLVNVIPAMLSQSLFAELSTSTDRRRTHVVKAARAMYLLLVPSVGLLALAAPVILGAFGSTYADGATSCLRWMAVGSLVASLSYLIDVCVNSLGRSGSYVVLNASNAFLVLGAVAVAAPHGLTAIGISWLVAQTASVLFALFVLSIVRSSRSKAPRGGTAPVRPSRRLPFLDGLRGLAASFVVVSHCWSTVFPDAREGRTTTQLLTSWMGLGHYAVSVFIVISGFSLGLVAWRGGLGWPGGMAAFFVGRFRRIVPTYWAAVVVCAGLGATLLSHPDGTLWDGAIPIRLSGVVTHLLLLQDVHWAGPAGSTAFWSLAVEWHIYLAFPLLILLLRRWPRMWLAPVLVAGVVSCVSQLTPDSRLGSWTAGLHPSLYALFVLGLVSARQAAQASDAATRRRHEARLLFAFAWGLVLAMVVMAHGLDPVSPVNDLWFGPLAALCIGRMAIAAPRPRSFRSVLELRPLVWLGTISYSLYLIHAVVIESVWRLTARPWQLGEPWSLVVEVTVGLSASIGAAAVFHRLVERRFTQRAFTPVPTPSMMPAVS